MSPARYGVTGGACEEERMKRKTSEQLAIIAECLQDIWRELEPEDDDEAVYTATDHIESAVGELEEARMELARSGR